jgi:hypothetical protein
MPNTHHLLDQVRIRVPNGTDYAIAKALQMNQSNLQRVFAGKAGLGLKAAVRVSEILSRDLKDILVLIEEDKAKSKRDKEFWERRSPRITAAIAIATLALGVAVTTTKTSASILDNHTVLTAHNYTLCELIAARIRKVISSIARKLRASADAVTPRPYGQFA